MQEYPTPRPGGWRIFVWFAFFFLLFDVVLFRFLLWRLPNESAWSGLPFYNFEYQARQLETSAPPAGTPRVLIAGSSLAMYSVLPDQLQAALARRMPHGPPFDVRILSHQGLSTNHLLAYADRILAAKPDVVVVPVGTVDFQLERPIMLGIERLDAPDPDVRAAVLRESLQYTLARPEYRMLAPWGWVREYHADLDANQLSAGLFAVLFASYRYRLLVQEPIATLWNNRFTRGRSYHEYAGVPVGGGGITHRGWTGREFELVLTDAVMQSGLWFQAPSELFAAASPETPVLTIANAGGADVTDSSDQSRRVDSQRVAEPVQWTYTLTPGWQRLQFNEGQARGGDLLRFRLSHVYWSEAEVDERGVRLTRNAGRDQPALRSQGREVRREDDLYRSYTDAQYRASFAQRVLRFDRTGAEYLEALKLARQVWATRAFDAELPGFIAFAQFRNRLAAAGVPLLIVNNPENPISLEWYGSSVWYAGYLNYLAADSHPELYYFFDASRLLEMQMFYDYHHLSYYGAERYSQALAAPLEQILTR